METNLPSVGEGGESNQRNWILSRKKCWEKTKGLIRGWPRKEGSCPKKKISSKRLVKNGGSQGVRTTRQEGSSDPWKRKGVVWGGKKEPLGKDNHLGSPGRAGAKGEKHGTGGGFQGGGGKL